MNETIRIGIVGTGGNTRARHIPGLEAQAGVEIIGLCNRSAESSRRAADEFGIQKTYRTWMDVIADDQVDAVVIGTWPYLHERVTVAALQAGKHVMCEARMATDAASAHRMLEASISRPDLTAQVVPSPFTLVVDRTIQSLIADGYIGSPLVVDVVAGGSFLDPDAPLQWRQDYSLSGMNILSLGIWYEALMRWVGPASRVAASGQTFATMRKDDTGTMKAVRIPDHVEVIGEMECGAQLHMQLSSVTGFGGPPSVTLYGSNGTLRFSNDTLLGGKKGRARLRPIEISDELRGGWRVEEEFVRAIRGQERITHTTFEDGVRYMEFTEAVNRSITSGKSQTLPL